MNGARGMQSGRKNAHSAERREAQPQHDWSQIKFGEKIDPELFSSIAQSAAKKVNEAGRRCNKPTQLRRFYDELCLWEQRVRERQESFHDYLPFIRMLNAKVAYAKGRELVDDTYLTLFQHTLKEVQDPVSLRTCKLFWEAFTGFYKQERPKD